MSNSSESEGYKLTVAKLSQRSATRFDCVLDETACEMIAQELAILALRKLSFKGEIRPAPQHRWKLTAQLGATVVQPCVITLDPVTTRIDQDVVRIFVPDMVVTSDEDEVEMPEDDTLEPLKEIINLVEVLTEALALYLPDYPRLDGVMLEKSTFSAPGITPMSDEDAHPFAGLAKLKGDNPEKN